MVYALVDCNNFYCSCERAFNPNLEGRPVVVLSNNDGCAIARSNEAKALGIKMGEPAFKLDSVFRQHSVQVYSSNYALYGSMSKRVTDVLAAHAPVSIYSIDEAFLDLTRVAEREAFALTLRSLMKRWTGIPISVGIAPTKTLAKLANKWAKKHSPSGVLDWSTCGCQDDILDDVEVGDVWGVGHQYAERLRKEGFETALALSRMDHRWAKSDMTIVGLRTVMELQGTACIPWDDAPPCRRTVAATRTFGTATENHVAIGEAVASFAARAAYKIRREGLAAGAMQVFIQTDRFRAERPQYGNACTMTLPVPSSDTAELIGFALAGLRRLWRAGYEFRKAGVILLDLVRADTAQAGLFDPIDRSRSARLMMTMDEINNRLGRSALRVAAEGVGRRAKRWQTVRAKLSPCYTTRWSDLPTAVC